MIRLRSLERRRESLFPLKITAAEGTERYVTEGGLQGPRAEKHLVLGPSNYYEGTFSLLTSKYFKH